MKYISNLLAMLLLVGLCACSFQQGIKRDGYRHVSFEELPTDSMGKIIRKPHWKPHHYIKDLKADSFYVYGDFDSIRMATPAESYGNMFRKTDIRAETWKATPKYGSMNFVGNFTADHLPGMFVSFYFTKDRSSLMQLIQTNPGNVTGVILFHKDSVNILKKAGIIVDPRDNP